MVLTASDMPAMPAIVTPIPAWAIVDPHTRAAGREPGAGWLPSGMRNRRMRSTISAKAPAISQAAGGEGQRRQPAPEPERRDHAHDRRDHRRPPQPEQRGAERRRFQGSTGPTAIAANTGIASGSTVVWK